MDSYYGMRRQISPIINRLIIHLKPGIVKEINYLRLLNLGYNLFTRQKSTVHHYFNNIKLETVMVIPYVKGT